MYNENKTNHTKSHIIIQHRAYIDSVHVWVWSGYGLGEEAISDSVCSCPKAPKASAWGQQIKQGKARVDAVLEDLFCSAEAAGGVDVHQVEKRAADDPLFCLHDSREPLPPAIPYCDTIHQQASNWWAVVGQQQVGRQSVLLEESEVVKLLLSVLGDCGDALCPGGDVRYEDTEKRERLHPHVSSPLM